MSKNRLEAFSDGVLAIIITIMVLGIKTPEGADIQALKPLLPGLLAYVLSFLYIGIYWNNHHHLLQATEKINGKILWANLHLLFWLSLVPLTTAWAGNNHFAAVPLAAYGLILLMSAIAYWILQQSIIHLNGTESILSKAIGKDLKGKISPVLYLLGVLFSFYIPWIAAGIYYLVAILWLVPDQRIEKKI